ncbi:uncharacterized protein F13E9.13, mitochondrial [Ceratitis capitata]|uniref:uncharacterized protein F13E9.13, mitochondrial n=1 Tax=Ceratitis capitata TaxID=7213 RepID=UPI000329F3F3|nr:uncharacterized protein F13E9.13, mitochondrial [Ceratitis capitata]XP_012157626.1 uncharacterized protein F13E9.13, mitochondrial [Ceratitis capitata]
MNRFRNVFGSKKCNVIAMIHVEALPGTPGYKGSWARIVEKAITEARNFVKNKVDAILIENMHDVPYLPNHLLGPETIACLSRVCNEIRQIVPPIIPCGIQILACGNKQALSVAKATDLQFIRAEGFVFGHVADEGYTDACAGDLLRYRKFIDAEDVLIFTDLKKKHSSHAITNDVTLLETAKAAEFFLTDGIVITGKSTGQAASMEDLNEVLGRVNCPVLIGSGVNKKNITQYYEKAQGVIIGSHFKVDGYWGNELSETSLTEFMNKVESIRNE